MKEGSNSMLPLSGPWSVSGETPKTGVMTGSERNRVPCTFKSLLSLSEGQKVMCQCNIQDTHGVKLKTRE